MHKYRLFHENAVFIDTMFLRANAGIADFVFKFLPFLYGGIEFYKNLYCQHSQLLRIIIENFIIKYSAICEKLQFSLWGIFSCTA